MNEYKVLQIGAVYQRIMNKNARYSEPLKGVECRIRLEADGTIVDGRLSVWDSTLYEQAKPNGPVSTNATGTFLREPVEYFKLDIDPTNLVVSDLNGVLVLEDPDLLVRVGYVRIFNNGNNSNTSGSKKPEHDM